MHDCYTSLINWSLEHCSLHTFVSNRELRRQRPWICSMVQPITVLSLWTGIMLLWTHKLCLSLVPQTQLSRPFYGYTCCSLIRPPSLSLFAMLQTSLFFYKIPNKLFRNYRTQACRYYRPIGTRRSGWQSKLSYSEMKLRCRRVTLFITLHLFIITVMSFSSSLY